VSHGLGDFPEYCHILPRKTVLVSQCEGTFDVQHLVCFTRKSLVYYQTEPWKTDLKDAEMKQDKTCSFILIRILESKGKH
jgi:hypothetical protein